ncbi:hypothetical protein [Bradyrhizobium sp. URHC0002]
MTMTNQTIRVYRADTARLSVTLTQADGSAFDPTINAEIKWRMSKNWHSTEVEALARKEIGAGLEVVDGGVEITLESGDTDFPPGLYHHELKLFDGGDVSTAMTGTVVIKAAMWMGTTRVTPSGVIYLQASVPTVDA